jgi:hypothetical protein
MKKIIPGLLCLTTLSLSAQHETLFSDLSVVGAFGSPLIEIGSINGEVGADVGGGGALILNNFFLGGYGLGTDYPEYEILNGPDQGQYNIKFNHGGLWLGYASPVYKVAHLYSSARIGWGRGRLRQGGETIFSDRLFVLTPEIGVELNLTSFFKLALTGGYRWVNGVSRLPGLGNEDFSSPVGTITFRFGGFGDDWDW